MGPIVIARLHGPLPARTVALPLPAAGFDCVFASRAADGLAAPGIPLGSSGHGRPEKRERIAEMRNDLLALVDKAREMKRTMTREEFVNSGEVLYEHARTSSSRITPAQIKVRRAMLHKKGLENLYSYLEEHPSGSTFSHRDPKFDVVF
jgi:hypothetical protein